ncbi:hypothetical protein [Flavobacterium sp.]|uniref:hypothetical protein n=1 Tax=Flavobacterium sp. TaxID=239 RepID=UPI0025BC30EC|nr:hypothetical protein [Flavobacterium sp.]
MIRTKTKIGDVFLVKITENSKKYFQYIGNDLSQLNSDVIRAFNKVYLINDNLILSDIVRDEVDFYAHCVVKFGIKMKLWQKVGNIPFNENIDLFFRDTNDYGAKIGEEPIKISNNWHVWQINCEFIKVGKITGEYRKSEIGIVVTPQDIIDRITNRKYNFIYPDFE